MTWPTPSALPESTSARARGRTLFLAWAVTALAGSFLVWLADVAFYDRFEVSASDLPSWDAWSALELGVQLLAWAVVFGLWLWWPRRLAVVAVTAVVLAVVGVAARAWAHDEAGRAWEGARRVMPQAVLPFSFSASPARMVPYGREPLPEGIPGRVLLLRWHRDSAVVYDPVTHHTLWVGAKIAVPALTGEQR